MADHFTKSERSLKVSVTGRSDHFDATRNPGIGQDLTVLAAAVQLRLRVAIGLQALQRCSGLLNRRARGSTVATHHFHAGVAQQRQQSRFRIGINFRANRPTRVQVSPLAPDP